MREGWRRACRCQYFLKTATALQLDISPALSAVADEVIE
jgi:hypothetical protein